VSAGGEPGRLSCRRCGAALTPGAGNFYRVTVEAVADPSLPPLAPGDPEELRRQIERLLTSLAGRPEQELLDQVFRRLTFHLCGPCYRRWIEDPAGSGAAPGAPPSV
jgi:hypothetical protein